MHPNAQRIQAVLSARGTSAEVIEFDASTRTAAEAAAVIGTTVAQIAKSLVFMAGGDPVLVVASGVNRVSLEKLAARLEGPVRQATAAEVKDITGFPIGGVPPLGHVRPMRVILDEDLKAYGDLWAAAGAPNAVFRTTPDDLAHVSGGTWADVREGPKRDPVAS